MPTFKPNQPVAVNESDGGESYEEVARSNQVWSGDFCLVNDGDLLNGLIVQAGVTFVVTERGIPLTDAKQMDALMKRGLRGSALLWLLETEGWELTFKGFESDAFTYNLRMIDALMPGLLGALMIEACRLEGEAPSVAGVIDWVSQDAVAQRHAVLGQFGKTARQRKAVLTYKMKKFLMALVLGMRTDEPWDGIERMPEGWAGRVLDRRTVEEALVSRVRLKFNDKEEQKGVLMVGEDGLLCWTTHLSMWRW